MSGKAKKDVKKDVNEEPQPLKYPVNFKTTGQEIIASYNYDNMSFTQTLAATAKALLISEYQSDKARSVSDMVHLEEHIEEMYNDLYKLILTHYEGGKPVPFNKEKYLESDILDKFQNKLHKKQLEECLKDFFLKSDLADARSMKLLKQQFESLGDLLKDVVPLISQNSSIDLTQVLGKNMNIDIPQDISEILTQE